MLRSEKEKQTVTQLDSKKKHQCRNLLGRILLVTYIPKNLGGLSVFCGFNTCKICIIQTSARLEEIIEKKMK